MSPHHHWLQEAADSIQPIRCQPPSAWAKAWRALVGSTPNRSALMKMVPEVPRLMLQPPAPTARVPMAAAALSPAPAHTFTEVGRPSAWAASGVRAPTISQLSYSSGSCSSVTPQIWHISALQRLCATSSSSIPEASE